MLSQTNSFKAQFPSFFAYFLSLSFFNFLGQFSSLSFQPSYLNLYFRYYLFNS